MYQEYFRFDTLPFSLTPNPLFFCELKGHVEAFNILQFCIHSGEGFIKIIGEVGAGKTLLCRKILNSLDDHYVTAYIPNPDLSPMELRKAFAREIGLDPSNAHDNHELITEVHKRLIALYTMHKKVVLFVDEAQALSDESLETIRLLTNLETEHAKLLQVVLFAQPELDIRLNEPHLRQLKQRITFSYVLPLMNKAELDIYVNHRLAVAGYTRGDLFTNKAKQLLYQYSQGIPRIVNILSHKALLASYGQGKAIIDHKAMTMAINDTESIFAKKSNMSVVINSICFISFLILTFIFWEIFSK